MLRPREYYRVTPVRKIITVIRIELNDEAVTSALARLSGQLGDMTDLMNDIGRLLVASTKERIAAGQDD